ncbi:hypothetical protein [Deinococcus sp. QL22]|uniref:hypothetical protein n=1 Tax=Deinococcus sp. QL22 TaxID=2939437 RepID=UPI002016ADD3|nr:hypothetical protein [Deinococcus sp. QL22]UQN04864.1 hypothetical protein M1R55_07980 [Deinococcus sp. QL22]
MKVTIKRGQRNVFQRRAALLSASLGLIAADGARSAELQAKRSLNLNVYGTLPGQYTRTNNLLNQIYASGQANLGTLGILVGDRAPYASEVEYGTGPHELSPAQLQAYLDTLPRGGLLRFGRTGQAYLLPGPYLGPATVFARTLTRERLRTLMLTLWT